MYKYVTLIIVLLFTSVFSTGTIKLTEDEKHWLKQNPDIVLGVDDKYPPFNYRDENGELAGSTFEYLNLIEQKTGIKFKLKTGSWNEIFPKAMSHKIDGILNARNLEARREHLLFTVPYRKSAYLGLIMHKDQPPIKDITQLEKEVVGVKSDTYQLDYLQKKKTGARLKGFKTLDLALKELRSGNLTGVFEELEVLQYRASELLHGDYRIRLVEPITGVKDNVCIGIRNSAPQLRGILNRAINSITLEEHQLASSGRNKKFLSSYVLKNEILSQSEIKWLKDHPDIVIAFPNEYQEPLFFKDKDGRNTGFLIDFIERLNDRLNTNISLVVGDYEEIKWKVRKGSVDGVLTLYENDGFSNFVLPTNPHFTVYPTIYTKRDKIGEVQGIKDLTGKIVAIQTGDSFASKLLLPYRKQINTVEVPSPLVGMNSVFTGRADAFLALSVDNFLISKFMLEGVTAAKILIDNPIQVHMGVRKDWPELIHILNKGIDYLSERDLNDLVAKWMMSTIQKSSKEKIKVNLTEEEKKWLKDHPNIIVGAISNYPPFSFLNSNKEVTGIAADFNNLLCERLGVNIELRSSGTWSETISKAEKKEIAGLFPSIAGLTSRKQNFQFTDELMKADVYVYTRINENLQVSSVKELSGLTIAYQKDIASIEEALGGIEELNAVPIATLDQLLSGLLNGEYDIVIGHANFQNFANEKVMPVNIAHVLEDVVNTEVGYSIREDWPELVSILNKGIATIKTYEKTAILSKWSIRLFSSFAKEIEFTEKEKKWLKANPVIRVGADASWAPFEFIGEDGEYRGISMEYLKRIEKMLGIEFKIERDTPWHELVKKGKERNLDMFTCVAKTPEREVYLSFTSPYISSPISIFGTINAPYVGDLSNLKGKRVAVIKGYAIQELLEMNHPGITVVPVKSIGEAFKRLGSDIDAYLGTLTTTSHHIIQTGNSSVKVTGESPYEYSLSMACRNDWSVFHQILQKALDNISSEERDEIYREWISVKYEYGFNYSLMWKIAILVVIMILGFFFWNYKLKREVDKKTKSIKLNEERMEALYKISNNRNLSNDELARHALEEATRLTASSGGYFHLYNEEEGTLSLNIWTSNVLRNCHAAKDGHYPFEKAGIWADSIRERKPVIHNNYESMPNKKGTPQGHFPLKRHISVPIFSGEKITAVAGVSNKNTPYNDTDVRHLSLLMTETWNIIAHRNSEKEKKSMEMQLVQNQKMEAMGTLAGGIAHDFNNMLGAMLGYVELVENELDKDGVAYGMLKNVERAGARAVDLVKQILEFSRQTEKEIKYLKPHHIVKEALKLLRSSIPTTIEVNSNIKDCGSILADATQIHQIVMNLCTNAYHAMKKMGGIMSVSMECKNITEDDVDFLKMGLVPGRYVVLEVSDTGYGMDKATQEKIFNPYFTTKPKGEGTGLGLSVVHGIMQSYGGLIKVYSEPGKGTRFHLYFPGIESEDEGSKEEDSTPLPTGSETVLLVDDEKVMLDMLTASLKLLGYTVETCKNGLEALNLFRSDPEKFDILITDMIMPKMTGLDLIKNIMKIKPGFPAILCTGFSENGTFDEEEKVGVKEILTKPILRKDLAEAIRKVLDDKVED